jgi:hypothetical protein
MVQLVSDRSLTTQHLSEKKKGEEGERKKPAIPIKGREGL